MPFWELQMMNWYVLFVKTGFEERIVLEIEKDWAIEKIRPFIPLYDAKFRRNGIELFEKRKLFPGYVFIETDISSNEFCIITHKFIRNSKQIFKLLQYGKNSENERLIAVDSQEQKTLMKLFNTGCCIDISQGFIEDDKVKVTHGPLIDYESFIKKVKRHKMEAVIEIDFMGCAREVTVGLEIISRI